MVTEQVFASLAVREGKILNVSFQMPKVEKFTRTNRQLMIYVTNQEVL